MLAILAILIATLRPDSGSLPHGWSLALPTGDTALAEVIQNVLLFLPLGVALALGGTRPLRAIALGTALSFAVEFIQQWLPGRDPAVADLICNTAGTAIGGAFVWNAARWLLISPQRAALQSLATAVAAATVWLGTGWLLRPALPPPPYEVHWSPDLRHWGRYHGRVLSATLGALPLSEGPLTTLDPEIGQPLRVVAVVPPDLERRREAPLVAITDRRRWPLFLVAVDRTDLVLLYRTRAAAIRLEQPDLRVPGALADVAAGDTFTIAGWRERDRGCLERDHTRWCGLGYTVGDGWNLIFFPDGFPRWLMGLLNATWVGGWLVGVGYWGAARRHATTAAALGVPLLALQLGPSLVGLNATPLAEWVGAIGGFGLGLWAARRGSATG